jgi:hypothetical protein
MYVDFAQTSLDAALKSVMDSYVTDFRNEIFSNKEFKQILMDALPKMVLKGYLN